jgi:hypothetical protein
VPLTANQPRLIFRLDTQPQHNNSRANTAHRPLPRCLLGPQRFLLSGPWGRRGAVMTAVENASACRSAGRRCGAHHLRRVGKCGKGSRSPLSTTEGVSLCFSTRIAFNEEVDAGEISRTLAIDGALLSHLEQGMDRRYAAVQGDELAHRRHSNPV